MLRKHAMILRGKIFYLTIEEFKKIRNIKYSNFEIRINGYELKYTEPHISPQICVKKNKTYLTKLYIPIEIIYKKIKILN